MSLAKGDHLRIQRDGKLVEPESEGYHEFEAEGTLKEGLVLSYVTSAPAGVDDPDQRPYYDVRIRVVR